MKQCLTTPSLLFFILISWQASAQVFENNYVWHNQDHSAWKIEPGDPTGYVIAGNKFFEPGNTDIYMTGFDEFGVEQWTRSHASGFSSLQTFWKSFVKRPDGSGYFVASSGTQGGGNKAWGLVVNAQGMKLWDRISELPLGIQFGGVTNSVNGGYIATGGTNAGNFAVVKFDDLGNVVWAKSVPVSGFGWTIVSSYGGYVIAGTRMVVKVNSSGDLEWATTLNLPTSPSGPYTYTEFEEIVKTPDNNSLIVTGSCFSNSHSGIYTASVGVNGVVAWAKVNDAVNTALAGTPVCWVNNAILDNWGTSILTSWRRGPVSAGGTMYYQRMDFSGANIGGINSLGNTILVREAFMTKAHGKYVVGGTRGNLASAYSYVQAFLPNAQNNSGNRNEPLSALEPLEETNPFFRIQVNTSNANPVFAPPPPTSIRFNSELNVFPNPSNGQLFVGGAIEPGALLRLVSPMGTIVLERQIETGETSIPLQLERPSAGLYSLEMIGAKGKTVKKVLIQ